MKMRHFIKEYERRFLADRSKELSTEELLRLKEHHLTMIRLVQHERLVHLLITLFFGLFSVIVIGFLLFAASPPVFVLLGLLLLLLLPYIFHYYFLENTVQRWYTYLETFEQKRNRTSDQP